MTDAEQLREFTALVDAALLERGRNRTDLAVVMGVTRSRVTQMLGGYNGRSPTLRPKTRNPRPMKEGGSYRCQCPA